MYVIPAAGSAYQTGPCQLTGPVILFDLVLAFGIIVVMPSFCMGRSPHADDFDGVFGSFKKAGQQLLTCFYAQSKYSPDESPQKNGD
jgi:hypothetical protein